MTIPSDIPLKPLSYPEALCDLDRWVRKRECGYVCFLEANLLSSAVRSARVSEALSGAKLVLPDGIAVLTYARMKGIAPPERIPGPGFMLAACEYGLERGWRHFFYGGAPGVPERLACNLSLKYRQIRIAGTWSPPFRELSEAEEAHTKEMIESAGTDLLWVGLGSPKQELWMARHVGSIDVPTMLGVGAAFDFHSGNRPWAPPLIRRIGMEWAYRMLTGGRKTFRRNVRCVSHVALILGVAVRNRVLTGQANTNR